MQAAANNQIEQLKAEKDGLDVGQDISRYAELGWESIPAGDRDHRLKWWGVYFRKRTPGYFMIRIRITNGITTSSQLRAIGSIANRVGNGIADITTRQQIELRSVRIESVPEMLNQLRNVGLVTLQTGMDNIRNVVGCPVAGLTTNELLDASPIAQAFTAMFVMNKAYTNLPRKFNVTITGCLENCTHAGTQDIAFVPATKEVEGERIKGFNVLVGGKNGSGGYRVASALDAFVRPEEAAEVASAITLLFRDHGFREGRNSARLSFLIDAWGIEKFREALESRLAYTLLRAGLDARLPKVTDHIGVFRQKQAHTNYVGLKVPVGRITGDQLEDVARLAETYGKGEIRLTTNQNLIIPHVSDEKLSTLLDEPLLKVFGYNPTQIMRGLVSCTGIEYCNLAVIETKNRALQIAREIERKVDRKQPITIHWSGCPAGCGNHTVADIGLLGRMVKLDDKMVDGVDIFVGGSSGPDANRGIQIMENVPCDQLPQVLEGLIRFGAFDKIRKNLRTPQQTSLQPRVTTKEIVDSKVFIRQDELAEGASKVVFVNGTEVAVFKHQGRFIAIQNHCPHEGASLAEGSVEGNEVVCPRHGYRFDIGTGACSTERTLCARTFKLVPQDNGFLVKEIDEKTIQPIVSGAAATQSHAGEAGIQIR